MKKKFVLKNWQLHCEDQTFSVTVPGDIVDDLIKNGVLPDVLFGENYKKAGWVHDRDWTYTTEFELSADDLSQEALTVVFSSIDTFAEIGLNGRTIGKTNNMFRMFPFNIKNFAKTGINVLSVTIFSIREMEKRLHNDKYTACFNDNRVFIRKPQCHFGWDWAPNFPGTGIAGDVSLIIGKKGDISSARILTDNSGSVTFIVELDAEAKDRLQSSVRERIRLKVAKTPGTGSGEAIIIEKDITGIKNILNVYLKDVKLWYPNGYGEQPLYEYEIELLRGEEIVADKKGRFAFRNYEVKELPIGEASRRFDIYCNGIRIRAIGSNWVPASIMTGTIEDLRYKRLLQYAKDGGINMLRVWGGGLYEKDFFYDTCDESGIMIWQDFMFACCVTPDDVAQFREEIHAETIEQIKRLRNHPSIVLWCGGNELKNCFNYEKCEYGDYFIHALLPGLCYEYDGTRKYVWDSPFSSTDIGNDTTSGDCHNNSLSRATAMFDIENYRKYQWGKENNFDSECAVLGMCRLRSLKKFMPEEKLWPQNGLWEDRLSCNPYDDSVSSFTERINLTVEALFGKAETLADYVKKSMVAHAEVLKDEICYYRSFEFNSGLLNWMYNDIWGNATWAIVDYYYEKKPAYYAMKRAGKRRAVNAVYRKSGYFVSVVNDTGDVWSGTLKFLQIGLDGTVYSEKKEDVWIEPFSQTLLPVGFDKTLKNTCLYTQLGDADDIYFFDLWKNKNFVSDVCVKKKLNDNVAEITITANEFARTVFIDLPDGVVADISDNYFDLLKGTSKSVTIIADRKLAAEDISVKTFADEWTE